MTKAQSIAAKKRYKREGGIGKNRKRKTPAKRKKTTTRRRSPTVSRSAPLAPNGKRYSAVVVFTVGGAGLGMHAESGTWGSEYSGMIRDAAIELMAQIGYEPIDFLKGLVALRLAANPKAKKIPLIGGVVGIVGQEWRNLLAEFNLRP